MWQRKNKSYVHSLVVGKNLVDTFLTIVDQDGLDVIAAEPFVKRVIAVQRKADIALQFRQSTKNVKTPIQIEVKNLHDVVLSRNVDLAYLDVYGNLTVKDCRWVKSQLIPHIQPHSRICLTSSLVSRGSTMLNPLASSLIDIKAFRYLAQYVDVVSVENGVLRSDITQSSKQWALVYAALLRELFPMPLSLRFYSYSDGSRMMMTEIVQAPPQNVLQRLYDDTDKLAQCVRRVTRSILALLLDE